MAERTKAYSVPLPKLSNTKKTLEENMAYFGEHLKSYNKSRKNVQLMSNWLSIEKSEWWGNLFMIKMLSGSDSKTSMRGSCSNTLSI